MSFTCQKLYFAYVLLLLELFTLSDCRSRHHNDHHKKAKREMEDDERALGVSSTDSDGKYNGGFNPECSETLFITPTRKTAKIEPESEVLENPKTRCHWNIIGTDTCIPLLSCKKFKLTPSSPGDEEPCKDEYVEVTDGSSGYQRFCGSEGPIDISGNKLRDLYITFQAGDMKTKLPSRGFKCTVTCSQGGGKVLQANYNMEVDETCNCGRKPNANRIVGGEDAKRGEFPWIVALVTAGTRKPYCGGTVINNRFIITAAHCFKGPYIKKGNFQILINGHFLDLTTASVAKGEGRSVGALSAQELAQADENENAVRFHAEKYFIHPLYVRQTNDYDVALIKLTEPIDFKKYNMIKPVCMPDLETFSKTYDGVDAVVAGWGLNSSDSEQTMGTLQKLDLKIFDATTCRSFFDERITRRMMCAGFKEGGKDSCKGDSGGPLISELTHQIWQLVGLVSWGEGCAANNSPGVYTKISEINQWVRYIANLEDSIWCSG